MFAKTLLLVFANTVLLGQSYLPGQVKQTFEVATIRPSKSGVREARMRFTDDGFIATNMPLQYVLVLAFELKTPTLMGRAMPGARESQIPGSPGWVNSDPYDIQAKVSMEEADQLRRMTDANRLLAERKMLQTLIAQRFEMKFHFERKEVPAYNLVVSSRGIKNLKRQPESANAAAVFEPTMRSFTAETMADLASHLSDWMECPVADKTSLAGKYDFTLQWTPDPVPADGAAAPLYEPAPYLRKAVEEYGLRLEPTKAYVSTLVIDHIARPAQD